MAKQRLYILLAGHSVEVWAAGIRYHHSCYKRFTYSAKETFKQEFDEIGTIYHPPKNFPNLVDDTSTYPINKRFKMDILWSVVGGFRGAKSDSDCIMPLLGSWSHFNRQLSKDGFQKAVVQYMPTVSQPVSDYSVLKADLDFLIETADNLELQNIFAHCDEAVYSKLLHIM